MRIIAIAIYLLFSSTCYSQSSFYLFVGGYTNGKNEGINVYKFNVEDGSTNFVSKVKSDNPSYLAISANGKYLYSANEVSKGRVGFASAFAFNNKTGVLSPLNQQSVGGNGPCFISINKTNKWLFTANYTSGSVSVLNLKKNGAIDTLKYVFVHAGSSINKDRQNEPHAHTAMLSPNEHQLFTTDLGTDKINIYNVLPKAKIMPLVVAKDSIIKATVGNGPRHIAFSYNNNLMYVINELSGTIDVFDYKNDYAKLQTISTDTSNNLDKGSGDIHFSPDGKFLYITNRGNYNNIAIFSVADNGLLHFLALQPTMGKTPRNFAIDPTGKFLLVANQNSDSVIIFKREAATGLLTFTSQIEVGNPTCLKFLAIKR